VALGGLLAAATGGAGDAAGALTLLGAILAAAAVRPDRRPLVWPAAASVQLAAWIAASDAGIRAPEVYTLPLTLALLGWVSPARGGPDPVVLARVGTALVLTADPRWRSPARAGCGRCCSRAGALVTVQGRRPGRLQARVLIGTGHAAGPRRRPAWSAAGRGPR
jgi:hypothetical protein